MNADIERLLLRILERARELLSEPVKVQSSKGTQSFPRSYEQAIKEAAMDLAPVTYQLYVRDLYALLGKILMESETYASLRDARSLLCRVAERHLRDATRENITAIRRTSPPPDSPESGPSASS